MDSSCLRCGKCCTSFGVCITPFDMARIARATRKKPEEFVDTVPEPPKRERTEPAIVIDGGRSLLVLKRDAFNVCYFYSGDECIVYKSRPMLCRTYPFRVSSPLFSVQNGKPGTQDSKLETVSSRACPEKWLPKCEEGRKYQRDCKKYEKEVDTYSRIADEWNSKGGGSLKKFVEFAFQ